MSMTPKIRFRPSAKQRQHAAQEQAVHGGLGQEDGIDHRPT